MKKDVIMKLHADFEEMVHTDTDTGTEFWLARDLQEPLGYARWENFTKVIAKAKISCKNAGYEPRDHFLDVTKKVSLGSGAERQIDDTDVRRVLTDRGIVPEHLPPSEDIKKIERRHLSEQKKLPKQTDGFDFISDDTDS